MIEVKLKLLVGIKETLLITKVVLYGTQGKY